MIASCVIFRPFSAGKHFKRFSRDKRGRCYSGTELFPYRDKCCHAIRVSDNCFSLFEYDLFQAKRNAQSSSCSHKTRAVFITRGSNLIRIFWLRCTLCNASYRCILLLRRYIFGISYTIRHPADAETFYWNFSSQVWYTCVLHDANKNNLTYQITLRYFSTIKNSYWLMRYDNSNWSIAKKKNLCAHLVSTLL